MPIVETPTTREADKLIEEVARIAVPLKSEAAENERLGRLSTTSVGLLEGAGLFTAMQPAEMGGKDLGPYDSLRVYEALATVDVPAQWVSMAPGIYSHVLEYMDAQGVKEMSKDGAPVSAGQFAPTGKAEIVEGGYRITGKWSYGSGILHATYTMGVAMVTRKGESVLDESGQPRMVVWFTPFENVTVGGNWEVIGLRATGSVDYSLEDVFVPEELTVLPAPLFLPAPEGSPRSMLPGQVSWAALFHCAAALGGGRRLLNELSDFATSPSSRGRLADGTEFRIDYAKAEARYRAARAYLYAAWGNLQESVNRGESPSRQVLTDVKTATIYVHDVNVENATFAFRIGGGTTLRSGDFQRAYADIMAMGQHLQVAPRMYGDCAKDFLGEAEGMAWGFFALS